ncbi:glycosyltransferase [Zymomonas mobilis]|uniref:Chitooligosaccharide deacetylase n=1 Tax=Zymomonas mobilis subsp. pomaceae (strain ATCC 29192 / DSM 22645 / JCM 10191 / CCUG 17912 / NBRC 13757 / NCIMB 11200 / NRRL B-4491 / Barker I) TaxID=579138 RepID=F8ERM0_ZYMMT|nr:glycosyltransferase [Zymomonas mobilis]AEI37478.1 polysaccharide deacetylase [Zymomonas mobilis subsp. pomaceae ATCC 29192]MDX5948846.1 glycosyltransferase [Zymomonas mobilis subsp. pomaceae]GEB88653.1 glycosyl transferase family 2 [Zymomonas mobilis subsp. pomaceae]
MDKKPVFYDSSGKRRRRFRIAITAFFMLFFLAIVTLFATVAIAPIGKNLPFTVGRPPIKAQPNGILPHTRINLHRALSRIGFAKTPPKTPKDTITMAFYTPWDDPSVASLSRHINDIDWLSPGWLSVTGPHHEWTEFSDPRGHAIINSAKQRPKILPMIQNVSNGEWDGKNAAALMKDPVARLRFIDQVDNFLLKNQADGVVFDFESLPKTALPFYLKLLAETHARFEAHHWILTVAAPVADEAWNLPAFAKVSDKLILMAYDEHYPGGEPGSIASNDWFADVVEEATRHLPPEKVIIALGSYAYNWKKGGDTDAISIEQAWLTAHESGTTPLFDKNTGSTHFSYDEAGAYHDVWMLDGVSFSNQMNLSHHLGFNAFALWRLGSEDPSLWNIFGKTHSLSFQSTDLTKALSHIPAGTEVDIEGTGEILRVASRPVTGKRQISVDHQGMITDEHFSAIPLPYAIERAGYRPGLIALTFDDGPDTKWTPQILDILKKEHVPATFFIIGENALTNRSLLLREIAEGHEIGNHTYTHPNLGWASVQSTILEVNATQRLFQAFTGHSLRFFRAPFFGDAEPTTADEIDPVYAAQNLGYLSVGLHVDPDDWKRPGRDQIIQQVLEQVSQGSVQRSAQIVLLHDSGGDRTQTIQALPEIIHALRAKGYRLVLVSDLLNLSRNAAMPPLSPMEQMTARWNFALFSFLGGTVIALRWIFALAITLGILRALFLSALSILQARRENRLIFPPITPDRSVTVLIPAFNEARVIESSVRQVLASHDVNNIEVIVIDDGSTDDSAAIVERVFADNPKVRLIRLPNGGKARALNYGVVEAKGEIIIALDADTHFEPTTIARLTRWFSDPRLGAVAGNAKVGNRINLITRWQALEYITAQNLERRATVLLNAMTVVPGAVGAWRAETLRQVGGFPDQTLAEDQDLTILIQEQGWKVRYDPYAVAWTEAPETIQALARQRFRWAFGTLQCLWKHRRIIKRGKPKGLAYIGLPQSLVFQIGFAAISPIIDLAFVVNIIATTIAVYQHGWIQQWDDLENMAAYWAVFTLIDLMSGVVAFALERKEHWSLLWLLIPQRIGYRQIMYYVVIKALAQAIRGPLVGWDKLERSGHVQTESNQ